MDAAARGSAATLAMTTPRGQAVLGPDLWEDMGEQAFVEALNAWGGGMHREVLALRTDLSATQVSVSSAFVQAQETVRELVSAFRVEVLSMRQTTMVEAQQSLERLTQVVEEARARFGEQDARFASGLGELAQRLAAADAWAHAEPARVAAIVSAAPVPPSWRAAQPPAPSTPPGMRTPPPAGCPTVAPALVAPPPWAACAAGGGAPATRSGSCKATWATGGPPAATSGRAAEGCTAWAAAALGCAGWAPGWPR